MIFLTALFLLIAQVLLESAAETNISKAFNWPIRDLFVAPASTYTSPHKGKFQTNTVLPGPPAVPVQPPSKAWISVEEPAHSNEVHRELGIFQLRSKTLRHLHVQVPN